MSFSIFVRHLQSRWNICFLLPTVHFRDCYNSSEISQWHVLLFNDVSNTYINPNCNFCHLLPLLKKKKKIKGISKFCELKWDLPVCVTPTIRICGIKHSKLSGIIWHCLFTSAGRSLPLQIWLTFCHSFLSTAWGVQKLWSSEGKYIYRDTLVWVPFSCTDSRCGFQESKIQTWHILSFLCRDEFSVSLQSNKNSDVGEKHWWVYTIWNFKPTNFLIFAIPCDWVQHPPLCINVFRVLRVMTESVSVFRAFFGPSKWKAPLWAGLISSWPNRLNWGWRCFCKWRLF